MIDTKAKRAAALGYGLSFLLVLPPADGSISIENAGHALNAYEFDMPSAVEPSPAVDGRTFLPMRMDRTFGVELDRTFAPALFDRTFEPSENC